MGLLDSRHRAVERLGREVADCQHLGARQSRGTKQFFRRCQNLFRAGKTGDQPSAGAKAPPVLGKQRFYARGDDCGDLAVELLIDDRLQQRLEDALRGLLLQAAFAGSNDDPRQPAVGPRKMFQGGGVIEFSWHNAVASSQLSVASCRLPEVGVEQPLYRCHPERSTRPPSADPCGVEGPAVRWCGPVAEKKRRSLDSGRAARPSLGMINTTSC